MQYATTSRLVRSKNTKKLHWRSKVSSMIFWKFNNERLTVKQQRMHSKCFVVLICNVKHVFVSVKTYMADRMESLQGYYLTTLACTLRLKQTRLSSSVAMRKMRTWIMQHCTRPRSKCFLLSLVLSVLRAAANCQQSLVEQLRNDPLLSIGLSYLRSPSYVVYTSRIFVFSLGVQVKILRHLTAR